jgi:outer membrane protein assembly factor BamD
MTKFRSGGRLVRLLLLALLLAAGGCASRQNLSLLPPDDLYAQAIEAFDAERWDRVVTLLEFFVNTHLGDPRVPDARMRLGRAYMERGEYVTAATQFLRLVTDFPSDPQALSARFLVCESYYLLSPRPPLDQEYTISALLHCQSIVDYFPGTTEANQAAEHVTQLRERLALKLYNTGMFYFRQRAYDSAVVYFQEVVNQYPNTTAAPAALGQLVETYSRLGYVEDAAETRQRLLEEYPQSPEAQALRV